MKYEEVVGSASKQINFAQVEIPAATFYAAEDADITLRLFNYLNNKLNDQPKLVKLLESIEYPMLHSLIRVERNGAKIDEKMLTDKLQDLEKKISLVKNNDLDYLDMLYREKFRYGTKDEIIIKLK